MTTGPGVYLSAEVPREVDSMVLIGSWARGDQDAASDVDVVAFAEAESTDELTAIIRSLDAGRASPDVSFTLCGTSSAAAMAEKGSLFLWHVRLEGRVVMSRSEWLARTLAGLRPYGLPQAEVDLAMLREVLDDVIASLHTDDRTLLFEAATLFTVLRNTGIVLSALSGQPVFGRRAALSWLQSAMGAECPFSVGDVDLIERARLGYSGKSKDRPRLGRSHLLDLATRARSAVEFASWRTSAPR